MLQQVNKLLNYVLVGSGAVTMSYRMGLAQTSKQLREEYLPIYVHKATVSACSHDMADFLDAFYKPGIIDVHGVRNFGICICHRLGPPNLFDVLPLMSFRLVNPSIEIRFHANPECIRKGDDLTLVNWQSRCKTAKRFCELDDPAWLAELRSGTFSKIDLFYILQHGHCDVGPELADPAILERSEEATRLRLLLERLPFGFCRLLTFIKDGPGTPTLVFQHDDLFD
jgi:hypothetical protein